MKIKVMGDTIRLKSALTEKDFDLLRKFKTEIVLTDEEDNELFRVNFNKGVISGNLNDYGITYNSVDKDGAVYTSLVVPGTKEEDLIVLLKEEKAHQIAMVQEAEDLALRMMEEIRGLQTAVEEAFED